ncbi:MAG TPA: CheR family methyltransferase [Dehalococcoidia bacterium]|nr:CheR family methyltransferase [Dehalococcoidia bacterium]
MSEREHDEEFEAFLRYLSGSRNFDFTAYKRPSLSRRVRKRMQEVGIASYSDYTDYLEVHPEEFTSLFDTILINVTSFFRDPPAWEFLANQVIPDIVREKRSTDQIRVWTAGCASGEEAYSIAVILADLLGEEQYRARVKIYATDVDEDALASARHAVYTAKHIAAVPERYRHAFEASNGHFAFRKDLRRAVIFGRHNLLDDAPISRVDLLVCRNTLMYLNAEGQARVFERLYFALNNGGYLFLGKAETLVSHTAALQPVDLKLRIFQKRRRDEVQDRGLVPAGGESGEADNADDAAVPAATLRALTFEIDPIAQIIIDVHGCLIAVNERARALFGLTLSDIGRPLQDLEVSYRPVELRSLIDQVYAEGRTVNLRDVEWKTPTAVHWLEITVLRLTEATGDTLGVKLVFTDVTRYKELQQQLERSKYELESAYEEVQSSNEELETMNEELQSTNEELAAVNAEMHGQTTELNDVNAFLESILSSLVAAVVVVDAQMRVTAWNHRAEDFWGLRPDEVSGQHFLNLDIGLPVASLRETIRHCLSGEPASEDLLLEATNRRGRTFACRIAASPHRSPDGAIIGVILMMEEAPASSTK